MGIANWVDQRAQEESKLGVESPLAWRRLSEALAGAVESYQRQFSERETKFETSSDGTRVAVSSRSPRPPSDRRYVHATFDGKRTVTVEWDHNGEKRNDTLNIELGMGGAFFFYNGKRLEDPGRFVAESVLFA